VYPGIDVVYYIRDGLFEYDFVVQPGADPSRIRLRFRGAQEVKIQGGELVLRAGAQQMRHRRPKIYQSVDGIEREIAGGYRLRRDGAIEFALGGYDQSLPLVIDPALVWSSRPPGDTSVAATTTAVAMDSSGNVYIGGDLAGNNATGATKIGPASFRNAYVAKVSPVGALLYWTVVGGSGIGISVTGDYISDLKVDSSGNVYATGSTTNSDFPTLNAAQGAYGGFEDAYVFRLNSAGNALVYSTYLGGSLGDEGYGIAVDSSGNAYVTGRTFSSNFPTSSPFQANLLGLRDAFVTKFNATGGIVYSTYLGGTDSLMGGDEGKAIAADNSGNAYVTGYTAAATFPVQNALQPSIGSGYPCSVSANPSTLFRCFRYQIQSDWRFGLLDFFGRAGSRQRRRNRCRCEWQRLCHRYRRLRGFSDVFSVTGDTHGKYRCICHQNCFYRYEPCIFDLPRGLR
jgi:hypothetical protein